MNEYLEYLKNLEIELQFKTDEEAQQLEELDVAYRRWHRLCQLVVMFLPAFLVTGIWSISDSPMLALILLTMASILWSIAESSSNKACSNLELMLDMESKCMKKRKLRIRNRFAMNDDNVLDKLTCWTMMYKLDREQRFEYSEALRFVDELIEDYSKIQKGKLLED